MALITEDGSGVAGANSYSTRAEYIAYAASVGVVIADDVTADEQLINAVIFIDGHEENLKGTRSSRNQSTAFPRFGLPMISGWYWSANEIPTQVINAAFSFALDINAGIDLYNRPANPNALVKRERVEGAITVDYAVQNSSGQSSLRASSGDSFLAQLLKRSGGLTFRMTRT